MSVNDSSDGAIAVCTVVARAGLRIGVPGRLKWHDLVRPPVSEITTASSGTQ